MKKLILVSSLVSSLLMATPAFAGVSWVQTPFWQTAYPTDFVARLENSNDELEEECRGFERLVFEKGGDQVKHVFTTMDQLGLPSDMQHDSFYVEMRLALPSSLELEDLMKSNRGSELKTLTDQKAARDLIPRYTQNPTQVLLQPESLNGPIGVDKDEKSLLSAGEKLGVATNEARFFNRGGAYRAVFTSKAAACDVLGGRATLRMNGRVAIKIGFTGQMAIQTYYADIEKIALTAMRETKSAPARAALLGFRLGALLSKSGTRDVAEAQMLGLITQLFDVETMTPNKNWTDGISGKSISVTGTAYDQAATIKVVGPSVVAK